MDTELIESLNGTTLDDLHGDLLRYGCPEYKTENDCIEKFPEITEALVLEVIFVSDECPACCRRFIKMGGKHNAECKLGPLLAQRGCEI